MGGQEFDLGFIPYRRLLTVYGIRPDHFWNEARIYQQTAKTLDKHGEADTSNKYSLGANYDLFVAAGECPTWMA